MSIRVVMAMVLTASSAPVGSEIFSAIAFLVISLLVLVILRYYLPLRTTPAYLLVPIFFALWLPAHIVLLVPIDLAASAREENGGSRGIWLPQRLLLVSWRITYWLTFALTWFILPVLAEYADAGYRDPKSRLMFSLRENAQYQAIVLGAGVIGMIYVFATSGVSLESMKGLVMALAYCWSLVLAIYLMGHGLVSIPRRLFRNSSISGRLRRIQARAAKVHEKMEDSIVSLEDLEAQVLELSQRKTGTAMNFKDWIEELADDCRLPESRPRMATPRISEPATRVPAVITERYLADLSRKLSRAQHRQARYVDEWGYLVHQAVDTQAVLNSAASKKIEIGQVVPHSPFTTRITLLTPYTRYLYQYYYIPNGRIFLGGILSVASASIVWSEVIKSINPFFSIVSLTVVRHPSSERGQVGFGGQIMAAFWILYMCAAALTSLTEVKVWRGRALVKRHTHGESAMWYAMQVTKLTVPLAFNFMTLLSPEIYEGTIFYKFLGRFINLTALGTWFDWLFPIFILVPVCATLFGLYGRVKDFFGFGAVVDDEEESESSYGTGSWREGRDLIERDLQGLSGLSSTSAERRTSATNSAHRAAYRASSSSRGAAALRPVGSAPISTTSQQQQDRDLAGEEDENFFESFGHRVRNTLDTVQTPRWLQNVSERIKTPKWMSGNNTDGSGGGESSDGGGVARWFGGRQEGRVRL